MTGERKGKTKRHYGAKHIVSFLVVGDKGGCQEFCVFRLTNRI